MRGLRSPLVWTLALLATVPPDALSTWAGWDMVDPAYVGTVMLWWPVDTFLRLALLAWLLKSVRPQIEIRKPQVALLAALNAEALLSVKVGIVSLLSLVPCLVLLAIFGIEKIWFRGALLGLGLISLVPGLLYYMRRSLAFVGLLQEPLSGAQALDWSHSLLRFKLSAFIRLALPWWSLSLALEGLSLILSESSGGLGQGLSWGLAPPSILASLLPLALFKHAKQ